MDQISEFHVERVGNVPVVDGQINGQPIRILLETGSTVSYLTTPAARQLNLPVREYLNRWVIGADGSQHVLTTDIRELKIGRFLFKNYTAYVVGNEIPDANGVTVFQLGADFLSQFTTEWDLAHGVVRLLRPQDCKLEQLAYWSSSFYQGDLEPVSSGSPSFELEVKINGKSMSARLASGSAISFIRPRSARAAGVEPGGPDAQPAADVTALSVNPIPTWAGRFDTFEAGGEIIRNARLRIGDVFPGGRVSATGSHLGFPLRNQNDLDLGADFLQAHRLVIVPDQHVALFTYNGGAVFQLERPDAPAPGVPDRALPVDKNPVTALEN